MHEHWRSQIWVSSFMLIWGGVGIRRLRPSWITDDWGILLVPLFQDTVLYEDQIFALIFLNSLLVVIFLFFNGHTLFFNNSEMAFKTNVRYFAFEPLMKRFWDHRHFNLIKAIINLSLRWPSHFHRLWIISLHAVASEIPILTSSIIFWLFKKMFFCCHFLFYFIYTSKHLCLLLF